MYLRCQACLKSPAGAWRFAKAASGVLALGTLWMLAGSCWATEPPMWPPLSTAFPAHGSAAAEIGGNHRFDLVIVESQGRGPQGFRYRIELESAARGAESSLEIAANAPGLLVTARDVDGIGNDLDLIIKSARSFTPIGIWINNHHGGFIKIDASVYAPSIWSESPALLSFNPTETLCPAILVWHPSDIRPPAQRFPGDRWTHHAHVERLEFDLPSRLRADPNQTRGPPPLFPTNS